MPIRVEINKNIVLLECLLNRFGQAYGDSDFHPLRLAAVKHFEAYNGAVPNVEEYIHESKPLAWAVTVGEPPKFESLGLKNIDSKTMWTLDKGKAIKPYLIDFYDGTDFEGFYKKALPKLEKMKKGMESLLSETKIIVMLEETWGTKLKQEMVVVLNPFTQGSTGPQIGNVNFQIMGIGDDFRKGQAIHTILHEGSHPIAKQILKSYWKEIDKKEHLLEKALKHPKYPKSYNYWRTCFEEHLIRAVHVGFINPKIKDNYDIQTALDWEKDRKGMVFIDTFYENLQKGAISGSIPKILEALK